MTKGAAFLVVVLALLGAMLLYGCQQEGGGVSSNGDGRQTRSSAAGEFTLTVQSARRTLSNRVPWVAVVDITLRRRAGGGTDLQDLNSARFHFVAPTGVAYTASPLYEGHQHPGEAYRPACRYDLALAPGGEIECMVFFETPDGYLDRLRGAIDGTIVFEPTLRASVRAGVRLVAEAEEGKPAAR